MSNNKANSFIFHKFNEKNIRYGFIILGLEPTDLVRFRYRLFLVFNQILTSPLSALSKIERSFLGIIPNTPKRGLANRPSSDQINSRLNSKEIIYPSFMLVAGRHWYKIKAYGKYLSTNNSVKIINVPSFDFDTSVRIKTQTQTIHARNLKSLDYAIFLDQYITRPNLFPRGSSNENLRFCESTIYYQQLHDFFHWFEDTYRMRITVASHPKAPLSETRNNFPKWEVIANNTPLLVRDSRCVISHTSTAVNFAVIFEKPIILLSSRHYHSVFQWQINLYTRVLGSHRIDISSNNRRKKFALQIDKKKYDRYRLNFINSCENNNKTMWEIFAANML